MACCSSIVGWTSAATVPSFCPSGLTSPFLGNSSGWLARLVEDWQVSAIYNLTTGIPMTIVGRSGLYESRSSSNFAAFTPETTVAPVDITAAGFQQFGNFTGIGSVDWKNGAVSGTYFPGTNFVRVPDPQCAGVSTVIAAGVSLRDRCNNGISALAVVNPDGSQSLVLQNAQPGTRGNLGSNTMEGPGRWSLDASLSKGFRLAETKTLQVPVRRHEHPEPPHTLFSGVLQPGCGSDQPGHEPSAQRFHSFWPDRPEERHGAPAVPGHLAPGVLVS
jgi:hypothetical protein